MSLLLSHVVVLYNQLSILKDTWREEEKGCQEQLERTHGGNQGGWKQGREVGLASFGGEWWGVNADNGN